MYFWRTQGGTEGAKLVQFFTYNTKIERQIIIEQEHKDIHVNWRILEDISERRLDNEENPVRQQLSSKCTMEEREQKKRIDILTQE